MEAGESFEEFVVAVSPRLQRAFVARYGVDLGHDALADALSWAWEHRDQLNEMENPTGYLYRVGQTSVRSNVRRRRRALLPVEEPISPAAEPEPGLHTALERLTDDQRVAVFSSTRMATPTQRPQPCSTSRSPPSATTSTAA